MTTTIQMRLSQNEAARTAIGRILDAYSGKSSTEKIEAILNGLEPFCSTGEETVSREDYDLSEQENNNLRAHLVWISEFVSPDKKEELAHRLDKPIEKGGVVDDLDSEDREAELELYAAIEAMTDHVQIAIDAKQIPDDWYSKADTLACNLRGHLPKEALPRTMHEVFQGL